MLRWVLVLLVACAGCSSHQSHETSKTKADAASADHAGKGGSRAGSGGSSGSEDHEGDSSAGSGDISTGTPNEAGSSASANPCADLTNACEGESVSCVGDTLVKCAKNQDGCLVTTRTNCARGGQGFCDDSKSPPECSADPCAGVPDACNSEGIRCDGTTLVDCAKNEDGCLVAKRTGCTGMEGKNACAGDPAECTFDKCRDAEGNQKADVCAVEEDTCAGDYWIHCEDDADGCKIAQRTDCTKQADKNTCDPNANPPACILDPCRGVTDCLVAGKTCDGVNLVDCQPNADGCLVKSITDCTQNQTLPQTCKQNEDAVVCTDCVDDASCSGKTEGETSCDGNTFQTCSDTDGDTCLNAIRQDCGAEFTCDADTSKRCTYSGPAECNSMITAVLREPMSYGPYDTTDAGDDYSAYTCPGAFFGVQATSPDLLFAVDIAPKTIVTVSLTSPGGFTGNGPVLALLDRCADTTMDMTTSAAEASCRAVSGASVTYTNEADNQVRVYVVTDANRANNADNVGTFGLTVEQRTFECGDGQRDGSEACDDGNLVSGDGCAPGCTREMGYNCTSSSPSICTLRPTDGVCANVMCPDLPSDVPANTQTCCTTDQHCGVSYAPIFGAACLLRDEPGNDESDCPDEASIFAPLFPPLPGCCRPDNKCGLRVATGAGCTERSQAWADMVDGFGDFLFTGPFESIDCTF